MKHVILDTDLGGDPDDVCALLLALNSPELKIDLIITSDEYSQKRAKYAKLFLSLANKKIPVVSGAISQVSKKDECFIADKLISSEHVQINNDFLPSIQKVIEKNKLTHYMCLGPESNLSEFIDKYPHLKNRVEITIMGSSLHHNRYRAGHNVHCDIKSAINVFNSDWDKKYVLGDITHKDEILINEKHNFFKELSSSKKDYLNFIAKSIKYFFNKYGYVFFWLHDPLTVSSLINKDIIKFTNLKLRMNSKGVVSVSKEGRETLVSESTDYELFWRLFKERILN